MGEWNAQSKEQKEILTFTAKIESITKKKKSDKSEKFKEVLMEERGSRDVMETKDRNDKTYHWCTKHKMWTLHKASECTLEGSKDNNNNKE